MPWAKIDDQYTDHPKLVQVGPLGMALHIAAICYCARYLTDGFIPEAMMSRLINFDGIVIEDDNGVTNAVSHKQITKELTSVGLLEKVKGGYFIHDYLEYNPSGDQIKAERAANKERQKRFREKPQEKEESNGVSNALKTPAPSPSPLIKNIGALRALEEFEQKGKKAPDVSSFPEHTKALAIEFINQSGINPTKKEKSYWIGSLINLYDIGAKPEDVRKVILEMRRNGLTIKSPESVFSIVRDRIAKSNGKDGEKWNE